LLSPLHNNTISGLAAGIITGNSNTVSGNSSVILTGRNATLSGASLSVLLSGDASTLAASDSLLFGSDINVSSGDGIVYLADDSRGGTVLDQSISDDTMVGRFDGGFQFFTTPNSNNAEVTIDTNGQLNLTRTTGTTGQSAVISGTTVNATNTNLPEGHLVEIRDSEPNFSGLLALVSGDPTVSSADNFITFFNRGETAIGAIEGDAAGGVVYKTGSADFAEFLPRGDAQVKMKSGEIVGIREGKIAHLADAESFMVVSRAPALLGNFPGEGKVSDYEKIAFIGQVPVKVQGKVKSGDFILASEKGDGTGIALATSEIPVESMHRVVGRAWESNFSEDLKEVNTVVGLDQTSLLIPALQRLEEKNRQLVAENEALNKKFAELLTRDEAREARLARLEQNLGETDKAALVPVSLSASN